MASFEEVACLSEEGPVTTEDLPEHGELLRELKQLARWVESRRVVTEDRRLGPETVGT